MAYYAEASYLADKLSSAVCGRHLVRVLAQHSTWTYILEVQHSVLCSVTVKRPEVLKADVDCSHTEEGR